MNPTQKRSIKLLTLSVIVLVAIAASVNLQYDTTTRDSTPTNLNFRTKSLTVYSWVDNYGVQTNRNSVIQSNVLFLKGTTPGTGTVLRVAGDGSVRGVTIGSGISFDGTTLTAPLTPWGSDINGAGLSLTNAGGVKITNLTILGGTLGAGKVLTDVAGNGVASWQTPAAVAASAGEATTNGVMQPFDVSKTWVVFMGDSRTIQANSYAFQVTNMAHWRGLAFCTNQALGGDHLSNQVVKFISNTLPLLPAVATNGTNVIISIQAGALDFNSGTSYTSIETNQIGFSQLLHSKGYLVVRTTLTPFGPGNDTGNSNIMRFNSWCRQGTNLFDRVPDFARRLPNQYDEKVYAADRIHYSTNGAGDIELAKEWDETVRFGTWPKPNQVDQWGYGFVIRDMNGRFRIGFGQKDSNNLNGVFFSGDDGVPANQYGISVTNTTSDADLIYNVANNKRHVFREGGADVLSVTPNGLNTPTIDLTGQSIPTGAPTGIVMADNGTGANSVFVCADSASGGKAINYKAGQGSFFEGAHNFSLGTTNYFMFEQAGAHENVRFVNLAITNLFRGKLFAGGPTTSTNGFASFSTNRIAITATGYTNTMAINSTAVDVDVYFDAATAAIQDAAGNTMHTFQAGTNITCHLKPNWILTGTTMAGTAIAH